MPKCDLVLTLAWVFSCKFAAYFQNLLLKAPLKGCSCYNIFDIPDVQPWTKHLRKTLALT